MENFRECGIKYNGNNFDYFNDLFVEYDYRMFELIEQSLALSGHISTIYFMSPDSSWLRSTVPKEVIEKFGNCDPDKGVYIVRKPVFDQRDTSSFSIVNGVEKRIATHLTNASLFEYYYLVVDDVDRNAILHVARKDCFTGVIEYLSDVKYYDMFSNPYVFLACVYKYMSTHYCRNVYDYTSRFGSGQRKLLFHAGSPRPECDKITESVYYCNADGCVSSCADIIV